MIICIRFFCVSFFIFSTLLGNDYLLNFSVDLGAVSLKSTLEVTSEWQSGNNYFKTKDKKEILGELAFQKSFLVEDLAAMPMIWTFEDLTLSLEEGGQVVRSSLKEPLRMVEMNELKGVLNRPLPIVLTFDDWPYVSLDPKVSKTFGGLESFKTPFFASLFGEDLATIFRIASKSLNVGEGFEYFIKSSLAHPFMETHIVHLKEKTKTELTLEITKIIERQRMRASEPLKKPQSKNLAEEAIIQLLDEVKVKKPQAVISGSSKGILTINRETPLIFSYQESGKSSYVTEIDGEEFSLKQTHEKKVTTKAKDSE